MVELPEVLWAYRITTRTGEIQFSLMYGNEVMVPLETRANSLRRENYDLDQNLILQRRKLDILGKKICDSQL